MKKRRELTKVGDLLDAVIGRVANAGVAPVLRLRQGWEGIAGEWAERAKPVALRDGVLTVEVATGMDASFLRYETAEIVTRARALLKGDAPVERIVIRVTRS